MASNAQLLSVAVQRALTSSAFVDQNGLLKPKQFATYITYLRNILHPLLQLATYRKMERRQEFIDKMYLAEPITEAAPENDPAPLASAPVFGGSVLMDAEKLRSSYALTNDIVHYNIEDRRIFAKVADVMSTRGSTDMELLAVNGNKSLYAGATDRYGKLYASNDGWDLLTDESNTYSVGGATVNYEMFGIAWEQIPDHFKDMPGMKWMWNPVVTKRLAKFLQPRVGPAGEQALMGEVQGPLGFDYVEVSAIPKTKDITGLAAAQPAVIVSTKGLATPISATSRYLKFNIDGKGNTASIDLLSLLKNSAGSGPLLMKDVARLVNKTLAADANYGAAYARAATVDSLSGKLIVKGVVAGVAGGSVDVITVASNAYVACGLDGFGTAGGGGATTGTDAGAGVSKNGTFIWFGDPANFLYGVLEAVRMSSFYRQENDRTEVVMYSWVDFQVQELDMMAKLTDVLI